MPLIGSIGSSSSRGYGRFGLSPQTFTNVVAFSYTGADQTFTVPNGIYLLKARAWGAAGGAGVASGTTLGIGGAGGYSYGEIPVTPGQQLVIVVGQGGPQHSGGPYAGPAVYGHKTPPSRAAGATLGGQGASCGVGGGLSGIFNSSFTHANSLLISGGGGGGTAYWNVTNQVRGGAGGGANLSGQDGDAQSATFSAYGRGGTVSAGGKAGAFFFKSTNGGGQNNDSLDGGPLYGGPASSYSSWTEGGGGGSGYYGGGPGNHDSDGGNWGNGGGGSGYAAPSLLNVVGYTGNKNALASQATSDPYYVSGIGAGVLQSAGQNGRVVLVY